MTTRINAFLLLPSCLILISLTYFYRIYVPGYKRVTEDSVLQKHKKVHFNVLNKSNSTKEDKNKSLHLVKNGIFWSDYAETLVPEGMDIFYK